MTTDGEFQEVPFDPIQSGDIVKIARDDVAPADIFLLFIDEVLAQTSKLCVFNEAMNVVLLLHAGTQMCVRFCVQTDKLTNKRRKERTNTYTYITKRTSPPAGQLAGQPTTTNQPTEPQTPNS